jgi:hypothetical protein
VIRPGADEGLPPAGSRAWWQAVRGRCIQGGAGVTGTVLLDGVGFKLGGQTLLPAGMTITPGAAPAAWRQRDPDSFSGYPEGSVW